ncbi:MAG: metal-dependent hydrolase [Sphingomonas sp.]|nr:metal-dependent hydrolase [Sphingomonas sp.]
MDNLTHSLAGALLGRMGLKRLTGRAMPALVISANLPDIDTFIAPLIVAEPIAFHRGFTHGIGGWILMPFVTAALVLLWNRWRPADQPVRPWMLLLVSAIGTLSHPALDFMNTYGVRLLEPLSDRWFYGDILFIIDPFIWIAIIVGLELSWRAQRLGRNWAKPAVSVFAGICGYLLLNFGITTRAETLAKQDLKSRGFKPTEVVASPPPLKSWQRRVLWRDERVSGSGYFDPFASDRVSFDRKLVPIRLDHPRLAAARGRDPEVDGFLFWSRMPMVVEEDGRPYLTDQRFLDRPGRPRTRNFMIPLDDGGD